VINGTFNETWSISETPRSIIGTGPFVIDQNNSPAQDLLKKALETIEKKQWAP